MAHGSDMTHHPDRFYVNTEASQKFEADTIELGVKDIIDLIHAEVEAEMSKHTEYCPRCNSFQLAWMTSKLPHQPKP